MTLKNINITSLPLVPLRDMVLFPHMMLPLFIGREKSVKAVTQAVEEGKSILLATQKSADLNDPEPSQIYNTGVMASIHQIMRLSNGNIKVLVEGIRRIHVTKYINVDEYFEACYDEIEIASVSSEETVVLMVSLTAQLKTLIKADSKISSDSLEHLSEINDPGWFADYVASILSIKTQDKQKLLETAAPVERLMLLQAFIDSELDILTIEKKVKGRVKKQIEQGQKEYYLQEQMKAIQKELGRNTDANNEAAELKEKIEKAKMPLEVRTRALKELKRLEQMPPMSAEGTVVRNYIDWLVDMPWQKRSKENTSITEAQKILDSDHYALDRVKERILEYLSVRSLVKKIKGPILCLVGPPGVGKTSLGKSIARATGREFIRISLGGVRDEAEIRGHRRTYIGSLPGKIIQSIKKAGTKNPVFMLDETDKMSMDFRGDPASALLEVLDPEQNSAFSDHFLEVDFDLSEVMFIATANVIHTIPKPLLDRMEIIQMEGYTEEEKVQIARKYLVEKNLKNHGLKNNNIVFSNSNLKEIIRNYTRESGVRNLDREIAAICRKIARQFVESIQEKKKSPFPLKLESLTKFLGTPKYSRPDLIEFNDIGVVNGLAWTEAGGEMLIIEVLVMPGRGALTLTGKLGDVMKESAQAALGYVRSKSEEMGLPKYFYQKVDIHIHVPEGAIPKDGPSAGIAIATAIVSALTSRPAKSTVAMTGEITLQGKSLQIGGVKEKLLAAHRANIADVILPFENEKDLKSIPPKILKSINIHFVRNLKEVLNIALEKEALTEHSIEINKLFSTQNLSQPVPVN